MRGRSPRETVYSIYDWELSFDFFFFLLFIVLFIALHSMKATQQHAKNFNAACLWVPLSPPSGGLTEAPQWEQGDSEYCLDCLGVSLFAGNTSLKFLTTLLHLCHIFATGACCIVSAQME